MSITLNGDSGITTPTYNGTVTEEYSVPVTAFKNRIINGAMAVSQRGTSGTVNGAYMVDRWYANNSGTALAWSQIYGSLFAPQRYGLQLTGAAGNTGTQINQRIESINSADLANGVVTVSGWFYQTTGSTMTLQFQIYYATVGVDNYTSAVASITAVNVSLPSGAWTYLSTQITLPLAATQGIQLAISPTALGTSQIFVMSNVQLEKGSTATSFDYRPYGTELMLCQRYFQGFNLNLSGYTSAGTTNQYYVLLPVIMRSVPTISVTGTTNLNTTAAGASNVGTYGLAFVSTGAGLGGFISAAVGNLNSEL